MLTQICPDCGGEGRHIKSRHGGNDPDTWDAGPCENDDCDDGLVPVWCEGFKCAAPADVEQAGGFWCFACRDAVFAE